MSYSYTVVDAYPATLAAGFETSVRTNYDNMRQNQVSIHTELVDSAGTASSLPARLGVALNADGTLKAGAPVGTAWTSESNTFAYTSASSFTITGIDLTGVYTPGLALEIDGANYGYVKSSTFATNTVVTVTSDSAAVPNPMNTLEYGQQVLNSPHTFKATGTSGDISYTGGNVGIGTASTGNKVYIATGTGSEDGLNIKSSGATGNSVRLITNAGDDGQLELIESTGTSRIKLVGDATTASYINGGPFGIGTIAPNGLFEVSSGTSTTVDAVTIYTVSSEAQGYTVGIDNGDSDKFKISDGLALGTNDRLIIDSIGNMGVGVSPTAGRKLDVSGNIYASGAVTAIGESKGSYFQTTIDTPDTSYFQSGSGTVAMTTSRNCTTCASSFIATWGSAHSGSMDTKIEFYANGDVKSTTGVYGISSDIILKKDITPATNKLDELMQLDVVNYRLKDGDDSKFLGWIAQDVEKIFPGLIYEDEDGIKGIKSSIFVPMIIKGMQEQQDIINELKTRIETLEA